jgi:hypothetical protein
MNKMNLKYKIKKTWSGFRQRYKLKTHLKITSKLFLVFVIVWLMASALIIVSQWSFTDNFDGTLFQKKYLKYFWAVAIELVSGFDIDPKGFNLNELSQILSVIVLITGIAIFAIFTGQIVSMFIHVVQKMNHIPEKPENFTFKRPIIICGINSKLDKIIEELRKNCLSEDREIVVVDTQSDTLMIKDKEMYENVWYVKGNHADRDILKKVIGQEETSAIILASESDDKSRYSDSRAIQTAMAIEGYREKVHTVLELLDERNVTHLKHTKINEWISIFEYGIKLTAQAALQHGMGSVYLYLLGGETKTQKTNQIYFTQNELPKPLEGLTYKEIRDRILSTPGIDITLIGFAKHVRPESIEKLQLELGNYCYIKQLNPVWRICEICGTHIDETDELGRIQRKCPGCYEKEKDQTKQVKNPWFYPIDTILTGQDKLIYLAERPVDCHNIFA